MKATHVAMVIGSIAFLVLAGAVGYSQVKTAEDNEDAKRALTAAADREARAAEREAVAADRDARRRADAAREKEEEKERRLAQTREKRQRFLSKRSEIEADIEATVPARMEERGVPLEDFDVGCQVNGRRSYACLGEGTWSDDGEPVQMSFHVDVDLQTDSWKWERLPD